MGMLYIQLLYPIIYKYIALLGNVNDIQTTSLIAWLALIDEPKCIVVIRRIHMVGCVHVLFLHS